ncbi:hypothetical protein [Brevibacillus brevis]|uniref:hypothetical protein n=1 Tax=Brevibacillus brevis TaxID=1393 RepID=UPI0025A526A7|nr:hypothetical protein [Brevibacillus brevis]WJQ79826.1 hypothetical protein QN310_20375 [Brevibacillus brevis]
MRLQSLFSSFIIVILGIISFASASAQQQIKPVIVPKDTAPFSSLMLGQIKMYKLTDFNKIAPKIENELSHQDSESVRPTIENFIKNIQYKNGIITAIGVKAPNGYQQNVNIILYDGKGGTVRESGKKWFPLKEGEKILYTSGGKKARIFYSLSSTNPSNYGTNPNAGIVVVPDLIGTILESEPKTQPAQVLNTISTLGQVRVVAHTDANQVIKEPSFVGSTIEAKLIKPALENFAKTVHLKNGVITATGVKVPAEYQGVLTIGILDGDDVVILSTYKDWRPLREGQKVTYDTKGKRAMILYLIESTNKANLGWSPNNITITTPNMYAYFSAKE